MIKIKGTIKKMYGNNAITLEVNGVNKIFSQYKGIDTPVSIGDVVEFDYNEREKEGKVYNNIVPRSVKVLNKQINPTAQHQGENISSPYARTSRSDVDWDEIARGKIRSLFIQAHIQKNGLIPISELEKAVLIQLVEFAMGEEQGK